MAGPAGRERALELVALAQQWLDRGWLTAADLGLRQMIEAGADRADARNMLGKIALAAGEPGIAAEEFRRALGSEPYFKPAARHLRQAEQDPRNTPQPGSDAWRRERLAAGGRPGFLVIRAWGAGFWSDVDHVLGSLLLAEITGRVPIVSWWGGSRWAPPGCESAWELYFAPVSDASLDEVFAPAARIFPEGWTRARLAQPTEQRWPDPAQRFGGLALLNRPEEVLIADFHNCVAQLRHWLPSAHSLRGLPTIDIYRDLVRRFLRVVPAIQQEVDLFRRARIGAQPALALHLRGSDKVNELPNLDAANAACLRRADAVLAADPAMRLFLLTDSVPLLNGAAARFGARLITTESRRTSDHTGVHFLENAALDRYRLGVEVLRDTLLAAGCDRFIGLGLSNVACAVQHLKDWPQGACEVLGHNLHTHPPVGNYSV
jgi:hypothetical protein